MSLIIPSAGLSSRFPNKPKWLLTQPNGNIMIYDCIQGLNLKNIKTIYIAVLKEHIDKYCEGSTNHITKSFKKYNIQILVLDQRTKSQCETVSKIINHFNIQGNIFIKDVDNYFEYEPKNENSVCFINLSKYKQITNIAAKSFIEFDSINIIKNISEKKVISDKICVGGYSFKNAQDYLSLFYNLNNGNYELKELYTSHIIWKMILNNEKFLAKEVTNYKDWGTYEEWLKYKKNFMTLFIDIDGTLFKNTGEFNKISWGENEPLIHNIEKLKKLRKEKNATIILTTSRKSKYREKTILQMQKHNVPYDNIIFDLPHCPRYIINDFAPTNLYPTARAINLPRNGDLNSYL